MKTGRPSLMPLIVLSALAATIIFFISPVAAADNLSSEIVGQFVSRTSGWWNILQKYALGILKVTATLEIVLFGIRMVLQKSQFHEIVSQFLFTVLFICFIFAVVMNYEEWAKAIALTGLDKVVGSLSGGSDFDPTKPVSMIFACLDAMVPVLKDSGIRDFGMVMIYVFCMGVITAVFLIICCRYIILVCEFHILANAGVLLIGLGGSKVFKEYAINVMKYVLSIGLKLFIFQVVCVIGFSILSLDSGVQGLFGQSIKNVSVLDLMKIIIQGGILLALASSLPQTCAGLISGASIDGGNPLRMAAAMAGGQAIKMLQGGMQSISNIRMANKIASESGVKGIGNRVQHVRQSLNNASLLANSNSIRGQLGSQYNAVLAQKETRMPTTGKEAVEQVRNQGKVSVASASTATKGAAKDMRKP